LHVCNDRLAVINRMLYRTGTAYEGGTIILPLVDTQYTQVQELVCMFYQAKVVQVVPDANCTYMYTTRHI